MGRPFAILHSSFPQDIEQPDGRCMNSNEGESRVRKEGRSAALEHEIYLNARTTSPRIELNYSLLLQTIESLT